MYDNEIRERMDDRPSNCRYSLSLWSCYCSLHFFIKGVPPLCCLVYLKKIMFETHELEGLGIHGQPWLPTWTKILFPWGASRIFPPHVTCPGVVTCRVRSSLIWPKDAFTAESSHLGVNLLRVGAYLQPLDLDFPKVVLKYCLLHYLGCTWFIFW